MYFLNQAKVGLKLSKHYKFILDPPTTVFCGSHTNLSQETFLNPRPAKQGVEKDPLISYKPSDKMEEKGTSFTAGS